MYKNEISSLSNSIILPDYHLHSEFSADADASIESIISTARSLGMTEICITDHYDMNFPDNPDGMTFELDMDGLIRKIGDIHSPNVLVGLEQGVMPSTCEVLNNYSSLHPGIDFIICSSHVVDGFDPYYPEYFKNPDGSYKDVKKIYMHYFEDILYNVQHFDDYNVYGHLDYIFRYVPVLLSSSGGLLEGDSVKPDKVMKMNSELFSEKFFPIIKDICHEILTTIIKNGKGIEINTGSLYRELDYMHPHPLILSMYKELGGRILTFGSDAHDVTHIGYAFDEARKLAQEVGFTQYCTFRNMEAAFHEL